jgi:dCMP deaminase
MEHTDSPIEHTDNKITSAKLKRWDDRYLGLAWHISRWSKDPNAQIGAVIANLELGRVISLGFNGFPSNVEDSAERLTGEEKLERVIHAEQNALLFAGRDARDCDLYVVGKPVCSRCAVLAIQSGIRRVISLRPDPDSDSKWHKSGLLAVDMFTEARVGFKAMSDADLEALSRELAGRRVPVRGKVNKAACPTRGTRPLRKPADPDASRYLTADNG